MVRACGTPGDAGLTPGRDSPKPVTCITRLVSAGTEHIAVTRTTLDCDVPHSGVAAHFKAY